MIPTVLALLESVFSIWASAEKDKYIDQYNSLRTAYEDELSKPESIRSDAMLDSIQFQLRGICYSVSSAITAENTKA